MWSVWLLLHSVFQNRYTNLKIFKTRFPAPPYISVLPEPSMPSNRMEYPTECVVWVELYFCLLSEIPSYSCFYSHSSCAGLLRSRSLQGSSEDILLFATFSSLWPFSCPRLPLIPLELWSRLPFVSLVILLKRTAFALICSLVIWMTAEFQPARLGSTDGTSHGWEKVELWGKEAYVFLDLRELKEVQCLKCFSRFSPNLLHM